MWDASGDDANDLPVQDAPGGPGPSSRTAAFACHERLAWLFQAISAPDVMAVEPAGQAAARRAVQELNNLAGETLAEWTRLHGAHRHPADRARPAPRRGAAGLAGRA